jgi:hypothetical protein
MQEISSSLANPDWPISEFKERVDPFQPREAGEITVGGKKHSAMLDSQRS